MRSLWLLHELGLEFEVVTHTLGPALRDPAYLAVHPLGRVPALIDGPVRLFESGAICEYLCEQYDPGTLWRVPGHPERAAWLNWLHFAETMGQHLAALTQAHVVIQPPEARPQIIMKLEAKRLSKTLDVLEAGLDGHDYLLPGGFSAVDTGIGYSLYLAGHFVPLEPYPNVERYFYRLQDRDAWRKSLPGPGEPVILTRPFYAVPEA